MTGRNGMSKVDTISYQGKDYATVPARLKEFREANPRAAIETKPTFQDNGAVIFTATIIQDRADEHSATATGNARYTENEISKPKAFEKLETISIGRALAVLGYLNNGEVATSEEMNEFENFKLEKVESAIEAIKKAEKRGDFESILTSLNAEQQKQVTPIIKQRMEELKHATSAK